MKTERIEAESKIPQRRKGLSTGIVDVVLKQIPSDRWVSRDDIVSSAADAGDSITAAQAQKAIEWLDRWYLVEVAGKVSSPKAMYVVSRWTL